MDVIFNAANFVKHHVAKLRDLLANHLVDDLSHLAGDQWLAVLRVPDDVQIDLGVGRSGHGTNSSKGWRRSLLRPAVNDRAMRLKPDKSGWTEDVAYPHSEGFARGFS